MYIHELSSIEVPIMVVGKNPNGEKNYVDSNIVEGAALGTEYLISQGHKRILLISGPGSLVFSEQTITGYKQALANAAIPFDAELIKFGKFSFDFGYETGCSLFNFSQNDITAIYSASGQATLGFMKAAEEYNINVRNTFSIVSFGENPLVRSLFPWIPFIKQPEVQIGNSIGTKLIDMIQADKHECEPEIFPVELIT